MFILILRLVKFGSNDGSASGAGGGGGVRGGGVYGGRGRAFGTCFCNWTLFSTCLYRTTSLRGPRIRREETRSERDHVGLVILPLPLLDIPTSKRCAYGQPLPYACQFPRDRIKLSGGSVERSSALPILYGFSRTWPLVNTVPRAVRVSMFLVSSPMREAKAVACLQIALGVLE